MKIIFDYQIFGLQKYGGISRYFVGLIRGLNKFNVDNEVLVRFTNNEYLKREFNGLGKSYTEFPFFVKSKNLFVFKLGLYIRFIQKYIFNSFNKLYCHNQLKDKTKYIFHPTYYDPYFLKSIGNSPFVLTVYDMVHENFPENVTSGFPIVKWKKKLVDRATLIIAISNNTKKELVDKLKINPDKIKVVYLYQTLKYVKKFNNKLNLPSKYILFIGERGGYKNYLRFLKAFKLLSDKYLDIKLVCGGGPPFNIEEIAEIEKLELNSKIIHMRVENDEESVEIYSRALMFVYPSLCEGFGIPLLEAFECRTPVVCSNTSCFPEVVGDAALMFDPYNTKSIFKILINVYLDKDLRKNLILRGIKRGKNYSVDKTITKTINIYRLAANEKS